MIVWTTCGHAKGGGLLRDVVYAKYVETTSGSRPKSGLTPSEMPPLEDGEFSDADVPVLEPAPKRRNSGSQPGSRAGSPVRGRSASPARG